MFIALNKVDKSVLVPSVLKWSLKYFWLSTQNQTSLNSRTICRKLEVLFPRAVLSGYNLIYLDWDLSLCLEGLSVSMYWHIHYCHYLALTMNNSSFLLRCLSICWTGVRRFLIMKLCHSWAESLQEDLQLFSSLALTMESKPVLAYHWLLFLIFTSVLDHHAGGTQSRGSDRRGWQEPWLPVRTQLGHPQLPEELPPQDLSVFPAPDRFLCHQFSIPEPEICWQERDRQSAPSSNEVWRGGIHPLQKHLFSQFPVKQKRESFIWQFAKPHVALGEEVHHPFCSQLRWVPLPIFISQNVPPTGERAATPTTAELQPGAGRSSSTSARPLPSPLW